jgi:two-component system osmolarity sensor histidine kinase EnvZ
MPSFWPRSLFSRNLLLLLVLAAVAHGTTLGVYLLLLRPQVVELGKLTAAQINTLEGALSQIPAQSRNEYIARMNQTGQITVRSAAPQSDLQPATVGTLPRVFIDTLRANVAPDVEFRRHIDNEGLTQFWVNINIGGRRSWISLPLGVVPRYNWVAAAFLLSSGIALLTTIAALLIQRRINRPLREIANAARKLGAGDRPERLPHYSTTELAAVADQFNAMSDSLEELESTRAVMLAGISHDIRTPLTKLRLALAIDGEKSERRTSRYIDQVDAIVDQFLVYGRNGSDEALIEGNLNTLIQQLAGEFEDRGHPFELDLGKLPNQRFRSVAMLRVISNLMENAVKYAGAGLKVRTWRESDQTHLEVLDRGPGIAQGEETRVVSPFVRANSSRSVSGLGLGLAIVDRLARLHGGRLRLSQREGGGLAACVVLPLTDVSSSA